MFYVENQYLSNLLGQNQILFTFWGSKIDTLRKFFVKIRNFSNMLRRNPIPFNCFEPKSDTFRMIRLRIWCFLNILVTKIQILFVCFGGDTASFECLRRNSTFFKCSGQRSDTFRIICVQIRYLSNVLCKNFVLLNVLGWEPNTSRMLSLQNTCLTSDKKSYW